MAITFENNNNGNNRTIIIIILVIIVILSLAGFLLWKMSSETLSSAPVPQVATEIIDDKVLTDARVNSLELFPQIPPSTLPAGKKNPFVETATSTLASTGATVLESGEAVSQ